MRSISVVYIKWEPSELGWPTLNKDGVVEKNVTPRYAWVMRDSRGDWIIGFTKGLGRSNTLQAELWGILEGLKLIHNKANMNLCVQIGCRQAFEVITTRIKVFGIGENFVRLIQKELSCFKKTNI